MASIFSKTVISCWLSRVTVYKHGEMEDSSVGLVARKRNCQIPSLKFSVILENTLNTVVSNKRTVQLEMHCFVSFLRETALEHINQSLCGTKLTSVLRSQLLLEKESLETARFPSILWVLGIFSHIS
jgi:hypothetical protein